MRLDVLRTDELNANPMLRTVKCALKQEYGCQPQGKADDEMGSRIRWSLGSRCTQKHNVGSRLCCCGKKGGVVLR